MVRLILNFERRDDKFFLIKELFTSLRQSTVAYYLMEPQTPTSIARKMGVSRTAITFTLNKFMNLGLIEKKKTGKEVFYSLKKGAMNSLMRDIILENVKHRRSAIKEKIDYDAIIDQGWL